MVPGLLCTKPWTLALSWATGGARGGGMCQGQLDPTPREADGTGNADGSPEQP